MTCYPCRPNPLTLVCVVERVSPPPNHNPLGMPSTLDDHWHHHSKNDVGSRGVTTSWSTLRCRINRYGLMLCWHVAPMHVNWCPGPPMIKPSHSPFHSHRVWGSLSQPNFWSTLDRFRILNAIFIAKPTCQDVQALWAIKVDKPTMVVSRRFGLLWCAINSGIKIKWLPNLGPLQFQKNETKVTICHHDNQRRSFFARVRASLALWS